MAVGRRGVREREDCRDLDLKRRFWVNEEILKENKGHFRLT